MSARASRGAAPRARVLVCDDEEPQRRAAVRALGEAGHEFVECGDGHACLAALAAAPFDLVLLDLRMPVMDGMATLARIGEMALAPPVVVLTADASLRAAIDAVKAGAADYVAKPYEIDDLRLVVARTLEAARLRRENRRLGEEVRRLGGSGSLAGESVAMGEVLAAIERVAPSDVPVLLRGETGTGKELAARLLHQLSGRAERPFVTMNCAAIPETLVESELFGHRRGAFTGAERDRVGKFEEADRGTLLLDEVGDMAIAVQAKLLRVLAEGVVEPVGGGKAVEVDVRVIAATHRDLRRMVAEGRFREDLLFRLRVVELELPPLRARGDDAILLAREFLAARGGRGAALRLDAGAERALRQHPWPGNVRELRNAIDRAAIFCRDGVVRREDLPADVRGGGGGDGTVTGGAAEAGVAAAAAVAVPLLAPGEDLAAAKKRVAERFEREAIAAALAAHGGNVSAAARALGLLRQNLQAKLKELGIAVEEFRR